MYKKIDRPIIFGEVLYDMFPDRTVLGGAPFNVAWHLCGFGQNPAFVSKVGKDELGTKTFKSMHNWGMDTEFVAEDANLPTGRVTVDIKDGQPDYTIEDNQAYDNIHAEDVLSESERFESSLIYHGTLALRSRQNKLALNRILESFGSNSFVDLNLRDPWWESSLIAETLHRVRWAKMSMEELMTVCSISGFGCHNAEKAAGRIAGMYDIHALFVTSGDEGSFCIHDGGIVFQEAVTPDNFVDSVGAGDAFSSVCILGFALGWTIEQIMERAAVFAARVCGERGALINEISEYEKIIDEWGKNNG